jgi:hypothetical protein
MKKMQRRKEETMYGDRAYSVCLIPSFCCEILESEWW